MGRIHKYATDTTLTIDDKVLGTDSGGTTKNFKLGDIGSFVQSNYSNLDIANGANNRIITASDADSLNGEANLTFDGSELAVTGTAYITKNLRRTVTAVAGSSSGGTSTHTCNLSLNDNFSITAANEANVIDVVIASSNIGQSGNIIITNPSSVGSLTFPISTWAGPGDGTSSTEGRLGGGLTVNTASNRLETTLQSVDGELIINDNGVVSLNGTTSAFQENPFLNIEKGLVTQVKTSIFDVVTATGLSGAGAGDGVPIGSILPHAQAFAEPPAGYVLCNGAAYDATTDTRYRELFDKIGTVYGGTGMSNFRVPNLTGGDVLLYGSEGAITTGTKTLFLSATESHLAGPRTGLGGPSTLSAFGVNFIIKYAEDPVLNIFNGAPNQVANNFGGQYSQQICHGLDSGGAAITLSSAGFITMALSGQVRNPDNTTNNKYDRYAIPVYSY